MATSERAFKRGDIVVVPFPYSDRLAEKRRPALVVSADKFNDHSGFLWVVMITSKLQRPLSEDIAFDHTRVGLSKASIIRIAKIATIEAERVVRVAGHIDKKTLTLVQKSMSAIIS